MANHRSLVHTIYTRQHGKCADCQTPMHLTCLTRAHRVPARAGGRRNCGNLDLLCGPCHRARDGHNAPLMPIGTPFGEKIYV